LIYDEKMKTNKSINRRIKMIRHKIVPVLKRFDVNRAALFGSIVRGDDTQNSDIDIVVQFEGRKSLLDLVDLESVLTKTLHRKIDILTYRSLHPLLKDRILSEQIRVL